MYSVRVKVCGIRTKEEAFLALEAGADALGFVFAHSPRRVSPEQAATVIGELPPFITKVGVFVNEEVARIREIAHFCRLDALQLHGDETPACCHQLAVLPCKLIKALAVSSALSPADCFAYPVSALLLDTSYRKRRGGGGRVFDWQLALPLTCGSLPLILAGGLNPGNVQGALKVLRPYALDVSSGVEKEGRKDKELLRSFFKEVRHWEGSQH